MRVFLHQPRGSILYLLIDILVKLIILGLYVPLYLLNESLPFIRVVSPCTASLRSPNYDEWGEPIPLGEYPFWHQVLALFYHLKLGAVYELNLLLHALFIALTDNGDDEIHEHDVTDDQNEEPEEPSQNLEVFSAFND